MDDIIKQNKRNPFISTIIRVLCILIIVFLTFASVSIQNIDEYSPSTKRVAETICIIYWIMFCGIAINPNGLNNIHRSPLRYIRRLWLDIVKKQGRTTK